MRRLDLHAAAGAGAQGQAATLWPTNPQPPTTRLHHPAIPLASEPLPHLHAPSLPPPPLQKYAIDTQTQLIVLIVTFAVLEAKRYESFKAKGVVRDL